MINKIIFTLQVSKFTEMCDKRLNELRLQEKLGEKV